MNLRESDGQIIVVLSPQEHAQLCAADTPNHQDQPAGAEMKRKIQDAVMVRVHMDGDCRVVLHVLQEPVIPATTQPAEATIRFVDRWLWDCPQRETAGSEWSDLHIRDAARMIEFAIDSQFCWTLVGDQLPPVGAYVACVAEHEEGGLMYWAGLVRAHGPAGNCAVMETLDPHRRSFIMTRDTRWTQLPAIPEDK